jgi:hypothetical protein
MPVGLQLAPQIERFIHDNPQGALTSFRANGMAQFSIATVDLRDGGSGVSNATPACIAVSVVASENCGLPSLSGPIKAGERTRRPGDRAVWSAQPKHPPSE